MSPLFFMIGYQNCFVCFLFLAAPCSLLSSLSREYWTRALAVKVLIPNHWSSRECPFYFDFIQHGCLSTWLKGILISLLFHLPVLDIPDLLFPSLVSYCQQTLAWVASLCDIQERQDHSPISLLLLASVMQETSRARFWAINPALADLLGKGVRSQGQSEHAVELSGHWQTCPNGCEEGLSQAGDISVFCLSFLCSSSRDHSSPALPVGSVLSKFLNQS